MAIPETGDCLLGGGSDSGLVEMDAMSDCNVCVWFDGDMAEVFHAKNVKARKDYACSECNRPIPKGTIHQFAKLFGDREWSSYRTCLPCAEIRAAFCCEGEQFGGVFWEQMEELFGGITISGDCLKKLKTPEAKRYFAERYRQWKERKAA